MRLVRIWLPVAIIAGGVLVIVATGGSLVGWEGGAAIIGAGLSVWLINIIFRVGVSGERDRDAEDQARDFYDEHGYWPDEAPPPAPAEPREAPSPDASPSGDPHRRPPVSHHPPGRPAGPARRPPRRP
jgi:hypothetical protein